jgi:hypothetical protein
MKNKLPDIVEISPTLKAVPRPDPFDGPELWWNLYVLGPKGWFCPQSGPANSALWLDIGVQLPAK